MAKAPRGAGVGSLKSPIDRRVRVVALLVCAASLAASACLGPDESSPEAKDAAVPAEPTVKLRGVIAGVIGAGVLLQNHSPEALANMVIVINENAPGGGYRFEPGGMGANTTRTYLTVVFRDSNGVSFEPTKMKAESFAVYADTPRGRGVWRGSYH